MSMLKQGSDFSLRDKLLFEITEVEITRADYNSQTAVCFYMDLKHNVKKGLCGTMNCVKKRQPWTFEK